MGIGFECLTKSLESVLDMVGSGVGEGRKEREWGPNVGQLIYYMYEGPVAFGTDNANRANMCHCVISGSLVNLIYPNTGAGFLSITFRYLDLDLLICGKYKVL